MNESEEIPKIEMIPILRDGRRTTKIIRYCTACIPLIKESLANSNIAIRCGSLSGLILRHRHMKLSSIHTFDLSHPAWKWENKIKLSNTDRRLLLQKISM